MSKFNKMAPMANMLIHDNDNITTFDGIPVDLKNAGEKYKKYRPLKNQMINPDDSLSPLNFGGGGGGGGSVVSVNGKQGVVNISKSDIGLFNVNNTSDLNKPISTAAQEALDKKQDKLYAGSGIIINETNLNNITISANLDYQNLNNKPKINDIELNSNKTLDDLSISNKNLSNVKNEDFLNKGVESGLSTQEEVNKKINYTDIIDNLTSTDIDKPLSANMGKLLNEIANGKNQSFTFADEVSFNTAINNWVSKVDNPKYYDKKLKNGDVALIVELQVSDRWYNELDNKWEILEIEKIDLTNYYTKEEADLLLDKKADKDLKNIKNEDFYEKGILSGLGQVIPEVQPTIELYIGNVNAGIIVLTNTKPTGIINIPFNVSTSGTTLTFRYTYQEDGVISALSRFKLVLYLNSIETSRDYQFSSTVTANVNNIDYLVGGDLYTNRFAIDNPRVEIPLENNVLPTNLNRKVGDYFEIETRITKSGGGTDSVILTSSPVLDSKLVRNGGDIGSNNVVDFNGVDTKTQSQRNREYDKKTELYELPNTIVNLFTLSDLTSQQISDSIGGYDKLIEIIKNIEDKKIPTLVADTIHSSIINFITNNEQEKIFHIELIDSKKIKVLTVTYNILENTFYKEFNEISIYNLLKLDLRILTELTNYSTSEQIKSFVNNDIFNKIIENIILNNKICFFSSQGDHSISCYEIKYTNQLNVHLSVKTKDFDRVYNFTRNNINGDIMALVVDEVGSLKQRTYINSSTTGTINLDLSLYDLFILTLTGNSIINFSNPQAGMRKKIILKQDSGGSKTVTWNSIVKWSEGTVIPIGSEPNKRSVMSLLLEDPSNALVEFFTINY